MTLYQKFRDLDVEFGFIGLQFSDEPAEYFCTPKGEKVIGETGVDGIQFCFVEDFGEMVFAVNPFDALGSYVRPVARNFAEFLGLILTCGRVDAIEQAHLWNQERFQWYLRGNKPGEMQIPVLDKISKLPGVAAIESPYEYIKEVQSNFDESRLRFADDSFEALRTEALMEKPSEGWRVTFNGGFWSEVGFAGKEQRIDKTFCWGEEVWHVPSIYICPEGLIVDFCLEVQPERIKAFIEKWNLLERDYKDVSIEERNRIEVENPLNRQFRATMKVNGLELKEKHSYGTSWIPASCMQKEARETDAKKLLEHYGYDPDLGWVVRRAGFSWAKSASKEIRQMTVRMESEMTDIPGIHFKNPRIGESISFCHPISGCEHTLTVKEYESQEMKRDHFRDDELEYPTHFMTMSYTVSPDIPPQKISVFDCMQGDSPRRKAGGAVLACSVGVAGLIRINTPEEVRTTCSSLYFEPVEEVEWRIVFREKMAEDMEVRLM